MRRRLVARARSWRDEHPRRALGRGSPRPCPDSIWARSDRRRPCQTTITRAKFEQRGGADSGAKYPALKAIDTRCKPVKNQQGGRGSALAQWGRRDDRGRQLGFVPHEPRAHLDALAPGSPPTTWTKQSSCVAVARRRVASRHRRRRVHARRIEIQAVQRRIGELFDGRRGLTARGPGAGELVRRRLRRRTSRSEREPMIASHRLAFVKVLAAVAWADGASPGRRAQPDQGPAQRLPAWTRRSASRSTLLTRPVDFEEAVRLTKASAGRRSRRRARADALSKKVEAMLRRGRPARGAGRDCRARAGDPRVATPLDGLAERAARPLRTDALLARGDGR